MLRYLKQKFMPKTLKVEELNKLEDLYYFNSKYLFNPVGSSYTDEEVKRAIKIVGECIKEASFHAEMDNVY